MTRAAVRRLVWNDTEDRPRTPLRLALGALLVVVAAVGATLVGAVLPGGDLGPALTGVVDTTRQLAVYAALVGGLLVAARLVDRRRASDLGLAGSRAWWADLAFGLALGVAMPALVFGVELALGYARVTDTLVTRPGPTLPPAADAPFWLGLALTAVYFLAVGVFEELLFRGYLLTNVAEGLRGVAGLGTGGALAAATAVTSLLFGVVHASNPNATGLAVVVITLYGGLLAGGYLLTGRVAVPIGVHVTWNLSVSSVFGFPVSGVSTPATLVAVETTGPPLVTGGAFGPEGGLVALAVLVVGVGALAAWVRWHEGSLAVRSSVAVPDLREAGDPRTCGEPTDED